MIKPFFSIITVTRNNLSGLEKTYHSILNQTVTDYEWIVIDGASTDGTPLFLQNKYVVWVSEPDQGIYDAMNKGILQAQGQYLIFMNAGDCFASPDTLSVIKKHTTAMPDFIYGDAMELEPSPLTHPSPPRGEGNEAWQNEVSLAVMGEGENKTHFKKARHHLKINHGMITHHQAMIYKAPLPFYNLDYKISADYDLTLQFIKNAAHIIYIPLALCVFESGGISQQKVRQGRIEQFKIRRAHKIPLLENSLVFILQTALYQLRRFFPKIYWFLKK